MFLDLFPFYPSPFPRDTAAGFHPGIFLLNVGGAEVTKAICWLLYNL